MQRLALLIPATLLLFALDARACNIPVFRYALERWRNDQDEDRYRITIFHRGPLDDPQTKLVETLRKVGEGRHALLPWAVDTVDLAGPVDDVKAKLWQAQAVAEMPRMIVRWPESGNDQVALWSAPLDDKAVQQLTDSPARREVARRVMQGESVVWVYVETGDKERDDRTVERVESDLRQLEKKVSLPDADPEETVKLLSALPLAVKFSVLRVRRDDAREGFFVQSLLASLKESVAATQPLLFPIFGRGRVLDGLIGKGINIDNLKDAGQFLCGPCSCQVKRLNPGMDLLIAADWDAVLVDPDAVEPEPPHMREQMVPIPAKKGETAPDAGRPRGASIPLIIAVAFVTLLVIVTGVLALRYKNLSAPKENS
jgi:hypothetical protein